MYNNRMLYGYYTIRQQKLYGDLYDWLPGLRLVYKRNGHRYLTEEKMLHETKSVWSGVL